MGEVHDLVYHGHGGFSYTEVYNMPVQYRKYHIQKINEHVEKLNEAQEKAQGKAQNINSPAKPNIPQADISTKARATKK